MTYTAASRQGVIEMSWLHFWVANIPSIFIVYGPQVLLETAFLETVFFLDCSKKNPVYTSTV